MNTDTQSPPQTPAGKPYIAWSYSALSTFENCPRKYWATKIAKKWNDTNKYNARGDSDHSNFQHYLSKGLMLPPDLMGFKPLLDKIKNAPGELLVERKLTLDLNFQPCAGNDWDRAWVRGAGDVIVINETKATYFDWKSGKYWENEDQIELTSLLLFRHFPQLEQVNGGLVFYNKNKIFPHIVRREQEPMLWNGFIGRVRELEDAKRTDSWPATPNPLCGYCPVADCPHNTNKELLKR